MEWHQSTSPKKNAKRVPSTPGKVMGTIFWNADGRILLDFLPKGETINVACYIQGKPPMWCATFRGNNQCGVLHSGKTINVAHDIQMLHKLKHALREKCLMKKAVIYKHDNAR